MTGFETLMMVVGVAVAMAVGLMVIEGGPR